MTGRIWVEDDDGRLRLLGHGRIVLEAGASIDNAGAMLAGPDGQMAVRDDGLVVVTLPSSDPGVAGALYKSLGIVRISDG